MDFGPALAPILYREVESGLTKMLRRCVLEQPYIHHPPAREVEDAPWRSRTR